MNGFLRQNAWHLVHSLVLAALLVGQWAERQEVTTRDLQRIEERLRTVEDWAQAERPRLDPIYVPRELVTAQNQEVLRRLEAIEGELRQLRQMVR